MVAASKKCTKTGSNLFYYGIYICKQFTSLYPQCQTPSAAKAIAVPHQISAFRVEIAGDKLKSVKSKICPDTTAAGAGVPAVPQSGLRQGAKLRVLRWNTTNSQSITSPFAPVRRGRDQLLQLPSGSAPRFSVPVMGCEKQQAPAAPPPLPNAPGPRERPTERAKADTPARPVPAAVRGREPRTKATQGQDKSNTGSSPHPTMPGQPCGAAGSWWGG